MLRAHLHRKLRRTGETEDDVRCLEDTATATLFERLSYLPDDTLIRILFDPALWPGLTMETLPTAVRSVSFWPSWNRDGDDHNRLEPDLVITFDNRVLVIEAKRFDWKQMQKPDQLAREWHAAHEQYPRMPVWLLAVSGLRDDRRATLDACRRAVRDVLAAVPVSNRSNELRLGYTPWYRLFATIERTLDDRPHFRRLLTDLRDGLADHGVTLARPVWLDELISTPLAGLRPLAAEPTAFPHWRRPLHPITGFGRIAAHPSTFLPEFA